MSKVELTGKHLIAGQWIGGGETFHSSPAHGTPNVFAVGTPDIVNDAVNAGEEAFLSYGHTSAEVRATLLDTIADEIDAQGDAITAIGTSETGLPSARLEGERGRTTGQLRLFATHIREGLYLDKRHDVALPDRTPLPRPDLKMVQRPLGPVAVFGASNFPLAFSTAGGDTAAALAAGCPVIVKGHSAHPGTSEVVSKAIDSALKKCSIHPGVFSLIQGNNSDIGKALVQHPLITAVGFTGSLGGGRALFDLCAQRQNPIPFFGELGSINPMFMLPEALSKRGSNLAEGWAASLTMGAGQFCTNPGVAIVLAGEAANEFVNLTAAALEKVGSQTMLTDGIAQAYRAGRDRVASSKGVKEVLTSKCEGRTATPYLYVTTGEEWVTNKALGEEVFGPLGMVVTVKDMDEMCAVAKSLEGQLTCTLHLEQEDTPHAQRLMPILERKAGRVLANGFPTGVEVCDSIIHGGPYPASTNFGHTSVGTLAIRRFLRPVCYQNIPHEILPESLK